MAADITTRKEAAKVVRKELHVMEYRDLQKDLTEQGKLRQKKAV